MVFNPGAFPEQQQIVGHWIGVAHRVGQAMCYWVLPPSGIPIARTTIQAISKDELATRDVMSQIYDFDTEIAIKLGPTDDSAEPKDLRLFLEDEDNDEIDNEPYEPEACTPNVDNFEADTYNEMLLAEPLLPRGPVLLPARVVGRKRDANGDPVGNYNSNPLLNTRVYLVEFDDGQSLSCKNNQRLGNLHPVARWFLKLAPAKRNKEFFSCTSRRICSAT